MGKAGPHSFTPVETTETAWGRGSQWTPACSQSRAKGFRPPGSPLPSLQPCLVFFPSSLHPSLPSPVSLVPHTHSC